MSYMISLPSLTKANDILDVLGWCNENYSDDSFCGHRYQVDESLSTEHKWTWDINHLNNLVLHFSNEEDYILFKMRWC